MSLFFAFALLAGCSALVYYTLVKCGESQAVAFTLGIVGGSILLGLLIWTAGHFRDRTGPLPPQLEVERTLFYDESGGLMEGCGLYVFRLKEAYRIALLNKGISKLDDVRAGREHPTYHRYEAWRPITSGFFNRGASCVELPPDISALIQSTSKTAYFTKGYEFDLLVDPISGLVVFSYIG